LASLKEEKESIPPSETQENKRVERIKIMNTAETEAQKKLIKFDKEFNKLLIKYPEILVAGDMNGGIVASITPNKPYAKSLQVKLPSFAKRVQA
jgi:hypothetical protein